MAERGEADGGKKIETIPIIKLVFDDGQCFAQTSTYDIWDDGCGKTTNVKGESETRIRNDGGA